VARATYWEHQRSPGAVTLPVASEVIAASLATSSATAVMLAGAASSVTIVASDGLAAKRCGWIENDMPSGLTLRDRNGTWSISAARSRADGLAQMPDTSKGDSCGCLTLETNRHSMRVTSAWRKNPSGLNLSARQKSGLVRTISVTKWQPSARSGLPLRCRRRIIFLVAGDLYSSCTRRTGFGRGRVKTRVIT
jgi:hypothetical protein